MYTTEIFWHGSDKHGPGTKKWSTESLFTRPSFCRAHHRKIKFWYELRAQFFRRQHTKKPPQYTCGTFHLNMAEEKYLECPLIKSGHLQLGSV